MKIFLSIYGTTSTCLLVLILLEFNMMDTLLCTIAAKHSLIMHMEMVTPSNPRYYLNYLCTRVPNLLGLPHVHNDLFNVIRIIRSLELHIIVRIIWLFLEFCGWFHKIFFSDLISGHQLSLEQVAGCHKAICQNSDKCINVI